MRIFGFEINRISTKEREEEIRFKYIIKKICETTVQLIETVSDEDKYRFYENEDFFLVNSERHKMLLKLIDLYSSNICYSPIICYELDMGHQQLDSCFMRLIETTHDFIKLNRVVSEAMDTFSNLNYDNIDEDEDEGISDIMSNSEKYLSEQKKKMYMTFGEYRCKLMKFHSVIRAEHLKVLTQYDFIKNRVHGKDNIFNTRVEHNRKYFGYNIKFRADLTPDEIQNQKQKVGGSSK